MNIYQSGEDYLESIYALSEHLPVVRSIDVVNELGYSKPSVSIAMKKLRENGYILMSSEGYITLTDKGLEIATRIYHRHKTLTELLIALGVDEKTAKEDACKIEHTLSPITFEKIEEHLNIIKKKG